MADTSHDSLNGVRDRLTDRFTIFRHQSSTAPTRAAADGCRPGARFMQVQSAVRGAQELVTPSMGVDDGTLYEATRRRRVSIVLASAVLILLASRLLGPLDVSWGTYAALVLI